jgi:hypothetical protein
LYVGIYSNPSHFHFPNLGFALPNNITFTPGNPLSPGKPEDPFLPCDRNIVTTNFKIQICKGGLVFVLGQGKQPRDLAGIQGM